MSLDMEIYMIKIDEIIKIAFGIVILLSATNGFANGLLIQASTQFLQQGFQLGSDSTVTPISKYANGIWTNGTAVTTANVSVAPWLTDGAIGAALSMQSYTNGATLSQTFPLPSIAVQFNAEIQSWGTASKFVGFNEAGFFTYPAAVNVQSSIAFSNLDVSANGLFWRLKERIAYNRATEELMAQKSQQEFEVSQEVGGQLQSTVDDKTNQALGELNSAYLAKIYTPYIAGTSLQGALQFKTEADRFMIQTNDFSGDLTQPLVDDSHPLGVVLGSDVMSSILNRTVAGQTINASDLIRSLLPSSVNEGDSKDFDWDALKKITMTVATGSALTVGIDRQSISIALLVDRISNGTLSESNLKVVFKGVLSQDDQSTILDFDQPIALSRRDGKPLDTKTVKALRTMFQKIVPPIAVNVRGQEISVGGMAFVVDQFQMGKDDLMMTFARGIPAVQ